MRHVQRITGTGVLGKQRIDHYDEWDVEQNRAFTISSWDPIDPVLRKRDQQSANRKKNTFIHKLWHVLFRE